MTSGTVFCTGDTVMNKTKSLHSWIFFIPIIKNNPLKSKYHYQKLKVLVPQVTDFSATVHEFPEPSHLLS